MQSSSDGGHTGIGGGAGWQRWAWLDLDRSTVCQQGEMFPRTGLISL